METVACIIVHYRAKESVQRLVESLRQTRGPNKKIIVVDNCSADGSVDWLKKQLPDVDVVALPKNLGYAAGVNEGLRRAQALGTDYYWIITQDITVEPNCLEVLTQLWPKLETPGFVGSLTDLNGTDEIYFFQATVDRTGHIRHRAQGERIANVSDLQKEYGSTDYVNGACLFLRADVLPKVGMMPEEYFLYYEDSEWGLRAKTKELKNYVSYRSRAHHYRPATGPQWTAIYYGFRNAYLFKRRNGFARPWTKAAELSRLRWKLLKTKIRAVVTHSEIKATYARVLSDVVRDLARENWGPKS